LRDGKKAKVLSSGPSIFCQASERALGMKKGAEQRDFFD